MYTPGQRVNYLSLVTRVDLRFAGPLLPDEGRQVVVRVAVLGLQVVAQVVPGPDIVAVFAHERLVRVLSPCMTGLSDRVLCRNQIL